MVLNLRSTNANANGGGVVTNSGTGTSVITVASNATSTFAGSLTGNLSLIKAGGSQLSLTSPSTYNGFTTVAGSVLELKDQGTIQNTTALNVNFGTLQLNNLGAGGHQRSSAHQRSRYPPWRRDQPLRRPRRNLDAEPGHRDRFAGR